MAQQPLLGQGLLIIEDSSHSDTPHSVGLLSTSDQPDAQTSTWQHTTLTRDKYPCLGGIRTYNPSKQTGADPSRRPRGHWDRHDINYTREIIPGLSPSGVRIAVLPYLFSTTVRPARYPAQLPIQWVPAALSRGVKRPGVRLTLVST